MFRIVGSLLTLALGIVGTIACIVAIAAIATFSQRASLATGQLFDTAHSALEEVRQYVGLAAQRVQAMKLTSDAIQTQVKQWSEEQAEELAIARLGVEEHVDMFLAELDQIEQWASTVETSTEMIGQALDATQSSGLPIDTQPVYGLLEETKQIQLQLETGIASARQLGQRLAQAEDNPGEQKQQIIRLTERIIVTLTMVDQHIASIDKHLGDIETTINQQKLTVARWTNVAAIAICGVMAWMALGQAALCYAGWRWLRGGTTNKELAHDR
ncbi:hypothetical protein DTL42_18370 [Bremerella cremea]|uniref:Uncharacterized protein n=1 Tax=Bremerella cremea TaxID=1031537 RepID=A0A368KMM4_9BACT|nr:hypothetical protein [Bremerella cremea]RCS43952.1 hypothetical protein DTL42_18370 [Bremerella cremea]